MLSRAPLAKQAPAPKAPTQAKSAQIKQAQTYFAQNETELASPQFAYSLAGIRTFAEGEPNEGAEGYFANRRLPFPIQAKLTVGPINDPLETEADRVADQVMRMPAPQATAESLDQKAVAGSLPKTSADNSLHRKCDCGGTCDDCKTQDKKDKHDEHAKVQMKAAGHGVTGGFAAPPIVHEVLRSSGQPLDSATRAFMEPRFGHDFSNVRIHTDGKAAESAKEVGARAYVVGRDVVFGAGEYGRTDAGYRLMAHELAHTIQQKSTSIQDQFQNSILARSPGSDPVAKVACPEVPALVKIDDCALEPSSAEESGEYPLSTGPFANDSNVEEFATALAECRAVPLVPAEAEKRYNAAVESAKDAAEEEAATPAATARKQQAITAATAKIDSKDKKKISAARNKAIEDFDKAEREQAANDPDIIVGIDPGDKRKIAAAKDSVRKDFDDASKARIKAAGHAVQEPDKAAVQSEVANQIRDELQKDFALTMKYYFREQVSGRKQELAKARKRIMEDTRKAKKSGSSEGVADQIEMEMAEVRCKQNIDMLNEVERVKHAWMISKLEETNFAPSRKLPLVNPKPRRKVPSSELVPVPEHVRRSDSSAPIAPEVAKFLIDLKTLEPNIEAFNRGKHGLGVWEGAGFSVDFTFSKEDSEHDDRGFYKRDVAIRFLLHLKSVVPKGGKWRVLYNDSTVANHVNAITGEQNVAYIGHADELNHTNFWHGPAPLILHFHLDIELPTPDEQKQAADEQARTALKALGANIVKLFTGVDSDKQGSDKKP